MTDQVTETPTAEAAGVPVHKEKTRVKSSRSREATRLRTLALSLHVAGHTPREIARICGRSRPWAYKVLREAGEAPHRDLPPELTVRQYNRIIEAHESGESMTSIAQRLGVTYSQVRHAVRET